MKSKGRKIPCLLCFFLLISGGFPYVGGRAWAGEPTEKVKATVEEIRSIFRDSRLGEEERLHKLRRMAGKVFDFEEMAKRSLGLYWRKRTDLEKKEFVSLYSLFIVDVYTRKIRTNEEKIREHEKDRVRYLDESISDSYASVETVVATYQGTEIPVEYRMIQTGGQWKAYDVIVSGVSLISNYRTQFARIIRSGSYEELVKRLKAKTE